MEVDRLRGARMSAHFLTSSTIAIAIAEPTFAVDIIDVIFLDRKHRCSKDPPRHTDLASPVRTYRPRSLLLGRPSSAASLSRSSRLLLAFLFAPKVVVDLCDMYWAW